MKAHVSECEGTHSQKNNNTRSFQFSSEMSKINDNVHTFYALESTQAQMQRQHFGYKC